MQTGNQALAHVLQSSRADQRVDLSLEQYNGEEVATLRYSTWTEGLGWCCQKTIRLDTEQLDELHRALTVARHRIKRKRADAGQSIQSAQVIQLPTVV
jgi:hypothetical protein